MVGWFALLAGGEGFLFFQLSSQEEMRKSFKVEEQLKLD